MLFLILKATPSPEKSFETFGVSFKSERVSLGAVVNETVTPPSNEVLNGKLSTVWTATFDTSDKSNNEIGSETILVFILYLLFKFWKLCLRNI